MTVPSPWVVNVKDSDIDELKRRLANVRLPDELEDAGWEYGPALGDVKRLIDYWQSGFDWRRQEALINQMPQYRTNVDIEGFGTLDIHFVHKTSSVAGAIPLLFCHGWPGSFLEVSKLLPLLTEASNDGPAFHVVAPSLPNFGFSQGVKQKGFGLGQYAEVNHKLMLSLGYDQYVTQGGDWGWMITRIMGLRYPSHVKASHVNMIRAPRPSLLSHPFQALKHSLTPYTKSDYNGFERSKWYLDVSEGYRKQQSTKPQTIGYSLQDSPVGLLTWIYEKLVEWTDEYPWTDDEILVWVSIYWFSTAGPAASARIYYEATHDTKFHRDVTQQYIPVVPLGMAFFPKELVIVPRTWARTLGPVVYESTFEKGGHFAAHERPDAISSDLKTMLGRGGPCAGVVKDRSGY